MKRKFLSRVLRYIDVSTSSFPVLLVGRVVCNRRSLRICLSSYTTFGACLGPCSHRNDHLAVRYPLRTEDFTSSPQPFTTPLTPRVSGLGGHPSIRLKKSNENRKETSARKFILLYVTQRSLPGFQYKIYVNPVILLRFQQLLRSPYNRHRTHHNRNSNHDVSHDCNVCRGSGDEVVGVKEGGMKFD